MIERYDCPEISEIWQDKNKFKTYLEVELALMEALEGTLIPKDSASIVRERAVINPQRITEIEAVTKHDVIAFCTSITENVPQEVGKFFHYGCTSSDVIDTATNLQIKQSLGLCLNQVKRLKESLLNKAQESKNIICMGRSHGMNAEPMSFGQKFLSFYCDVSRVYSDLQHYYENEITGQLSGAVGNYTVLSPEIEKTAIEKLGLKVEPVSTQVIPRDRIAKLMNLHAQLASVMERIAVEIRHLHHSDIGEVYEGFSKGQKGSSTMPHKKNPISGENITGIARVIRSHAIIALENIALWHERDISHSSAERLILPDNFGLVYYSTRRLTSTIDNLVINKERIEQKVLENYTYLSSYILHKVISSEAATREEIYAIVQSAAFEARDAKELVEKVKAKFKKVDLSELDKMDLTALKKTFMKHIDTVFARTLEQYQ